MLCVVLKACLNHYSRKKCLLPITSSKSQPNFAVGGQVFPPCRTGCQRGGQRDIISQHCFKLLLNIVNFTVLWMDGNIRQTYGVVLHVRVTFFSKTLVHCLLYNIVLKFAFMLKSQYYREKQMCTSFTQLSWKK